jgi:hypothetical protein
VKCDCDGYVPVLARLLAGGLATVLALSLALLLGAPAGAAAPATAGRPAVYAQRLAQLQATPTSARATGATFDPDIVISDANFRAAGSMTRAQVQSFLAAQSGILASYSAPNVDGVVEPASELIWEAAQAWDVSPKVILATLQKEQGLLTAAAPTSYALDWAMGCGVPDSGGLQTKYQGFGKQVWYGADSLAVDGAGWYAGITKKCGDGSVSPANVSTCSLYTYTPWIAGNQLFWTVYWRYFGDPVGDVTPPTTTVNGVDKAWHADPVTVSFTAIDDAGGSGVAYTQCSLDDGHHWKRVTSVTIAAPADHSGDGIHTIDYRSVDDSGNREPVRSCQVRIDTTAPSTSAVAPSGWHRQAVTVSLAAVDPKPAGSATVSPAASGVASVEYSTDAGVTWTRGTSLIIPALSDHSGDGAQHVLVRSADVAGNLASVRTVTVGIDTRRPHSYARWAANAWRSRTAVLRYYVSDPRPGSPAATVLLEIRQSGRVVKRLVRRGAVNTQVQARFACRLAKGTYRFTVVATDAAGNEQATPVGNRLTVH